MAMIGGDRLLAKLEEIRKKVGEGEVLRVGFLEGATYPDGTPVAYIAAIEEYGDPSHSIPSRPFFRQMIAENKPGWGVRMAASLKASSYDANAALSMMGYVMREQLQASIIKTTEPALSPITVMLRGMRSNDSDLVVTGSTVGEAARRVDEGKTNYGASTKPLNDSGHMQNSTGFDVGKVG